MSWSFESCGERIEMQVVQRPSREGRDGGGRRPGDERGKRRAASGKWWAKGKGKKQCQIGKEAKKKIKFKP